MKNIIIENVAACACEGTKDVAGGNYPFIWVEKGLDIGGLSINNISREEKIYKTFNMFNRLRISTIKSVFIFTFRCTKWHTNTKIIATECDNNKVDIFKIIC